MSVHTSPRVRQCGITAELLTLTTLDDVVYIDSHVLETPAGIGRTAEQWARTIMEDVPEEVRARLRAAWAGIELDLTPDAPETVAGWRITFSAPDRLLLRADSGLGFHGELALEIRDGVVALSTFVAMLGTRAPDVWFGVVPGHLAFVRTLLERAGSTEPAAS